MDENKKLLEADNDWANREIEKLEAVIENVMEDVEETELVEVLEALIKKIEQM